MEGRKGGAGEAVWGVDGGGGCCWLGDVESVERVEVAEVGGRGDEGVYLQSCKAEVRAGERGGGQGARRATDRNSSSSCGGNGQAGWDGHLL